MGTVRGMSAIYVLFQMAVSRKIAAVRTTNTNGEKFLAITTLGDY